MRHTAVSVRRSGFTALESLLMIGVMTVMALMTWAIYLKETDPERKGPGVWEKVEEPFIPAFRETDEPIIIVPDPPLETKFGQPE